MKFELRIFKRKYSRDNSGWNHLRFAVINLDKSDTYPANFVSMLPMRIDSTGNVPSVFSKYFGNKSLETARNLLTSALRREDDSEIKSEIARRLNLLDPNPAIYIKCRGCKKFFQAKKEKAFKRKVCPECKKRFGRREQTRIPILK